MSDLRFPIGKFSWDGPLPDAQQRESLIAEIEVLPGQLRSAVQGLSPEQLDTPYRDGGWNVRQVVHHVPDSHMNAFIRFKMALTEENPTIKPYDQAAWAEVVDVRLTPIEVSLVLLDSLHSRWVRLLRGMKAEEWSRSFVHPDIGVVPLGKNLGLYAWHGRHHVAHVTGLRKRKGW